MFAVSVIFTIHPEYITPFRELVQQHAARTLNREDGCRRFDVGYDAENPQRVFLYELYDSREAFDQHAATDYVANFFAVAGDWIAAKEAHRWVVVD